MNCFVQPIWTNNGMDIVFDSKNKPTKEFLIFLKIQDGGLRSKVQNRSNLTPQITQEIDRVMRIYYSKIITMFLHD